MVNVTVKANESKDQNNRYPRLMNLKTQTEVIVFFESEGIGYQLTGEMGSDEQRYWKNWNMGRFEDFTGTLELRNA